MIWQLISILIWLTFLSSSNVQSQDKVTGERNIHDIQNAKPPLYLGEPPSNEGTNLLVDNDGSLKFIYREGDWYVEVLL